jgi:hypothetical protein
MDLLEENRLVVGFVVAMLIIAGIYFLLNNGASA